MFRARSSHLYGHTRRFEQAFSKNHLCQAEIQDLGVSSLGDENIRWFNIAMNNSFAVCCIQCICNFNC